MSKKFKFNRVSALVAGLAAGVAGCASSPELIDRSGTNLMEPGVQVQTLTNLHPDERQNKLYAVNYLQAGLIPVCTGVTLNALSRKRLEFTVEETGQKYAYDYHSAAVDPLAEHLLHVFGSECDREAIDQLSEVDRRGIKEGRAREGMSKDGVLFALGRPPKHRTPSLESNQWRYWRNRFATIVVNFDQNGVVSRIDR